MPHQLHMKSMASFDELIRTANSKYWWWHYVKVTETERLKKKKQTNGNNNCDPLEEYMVRTVIRAFSSHFKMKYKTVDYIAIVQRKKIQRTFKATFLLSSVQSLWDWLFLQTGYSIFVYSHYGNRRQSHCRGGVYPFN